MLSQILESVNKRYVNSVKGDYWKGSYFEDIVKLTNDERGNCLLYTSDAADE